MSASLRQPRLGPAAALLAAVSLLAIPLSADDRPGATVVISWEAPGDDDLDGIATRYQVRYRTTPPLGDTLAYWNAATIVSGVPAPGWPGTTDSVVVTDLDPSVTYWFIVRAADEVPNWSGFSDILERPARPDHVPPSRVEDLAPPGGAFARPPAIDTLRTPAPR